jgi:hypothetical protein
MNWGQRLGLHMFLHLLKQFCPTCATSYSTSERDTPPAALRATSLGHHV